MLAVEQLLGIEAVGGLYQPLRTADLRPRGAIRADVEPASPLFDNDRLAADELRELIDAQLAAALVAAGELDERRARAATGRPARPAAAAAFRRSAAARRDERAARVHR